MGGLKTTPGQPDEGHVCALRGEEFRAEFQIFPAPLSDEHADVVVALYVGGDAVAPLYASSPHFASLRELEALAAYLEAHMGAIVDGTVGDGAAEFLPRELGFQLQALYGEADSPESGTFGVRVAANARRKDSRASVYVGCEGDIAFEAARRFVRRLRHVVEALRTSRG